MGRHQPKPCELPFVYWVFGRPISIRNEEDGVPKGLSAWKSRINKIVETEVSALTKKRGYRPFEGRVGVDLVWLSPAPHALDNPDLDNILKPFIDALCARVIDVDRQVDRIVAERHDVNSPPDRVAAMMPDFSNASDFEGEVTVVFVERLS